MNRQCPNCSTRSIPVKDVLFADGYCVRCHEQVGIHGVVAAISSFVILIITLTSTLAVFFQLGPWAALVWFTAPIGALSFLKARFGPLRIKAQHELQHVPKHQNPV